MIRTIMAPELKEHIGVWVAERIPDTTPDWGNFKAMGVFDGSTLIAGVIYNKWSPEYGTIELSTAADSPRWLTRNTITAILGYPFSFCQMVIGQNEPESRMHKLWRRFGANEILIPRMRGRDRDCVITTLTDDQWAVHPMNKDRIDG